MTQKEKIIEAKIMCSRLKSMADRLRFDSKDFGVSFPLSYANELERMADNYLKLK